MKNVIIFLFFVVSKSLLAQNGIITISSSTPSTSCSEGSIQVNFTTTGTFANPNFTIKLNRRVSCYANGNNVVTEMVSVNTTSSPFTITLPTLLPTGNTGGGCSSPSSGYTPETRSYFLTISNGIDISPSYNVGILASCSSIQYVNASSTCFGSNTFTSYFGTLGISSGNIFTAELSDLGGTIFPSTPIVIGTLSSSTATSIPLTLPNGTAAGTYKVKIKSSNPVGENTGNLTIIGIPTGLPTLTKNPTTPVASGTSVTLTASDCPNGNGVMWSTGSFGTSISVSPNTTTIYTATCNNNCGQAPTSATITVEIVTPPTITPDKYSVCSGADAVFTATGCTSPDIVTWYNASTSATLGTGLTITVNPTTYTVYATKCTRSGIQSGYSNSQGISITSPPPAPTAISKSPSTSVGPYNTVLLTVTTGGYNVKWNDGVYGNPRYVNPSTTSTYTAKNIASNSSPCESTTGISTTVTVDPILTLGIAISSPSEYNSVINNKVCSSQNLNFSSAGCVNPDVAKWYRKTFGGTGVQIGTGTTLVTNNLSYDMSSGATIYYYATCTRGATTTPASNEVAISVTQISNPNGIIATPSGSVAPNTSVSLSSNGSCPSPSTIKWDDNSSVSTRVVTPASTTTYTLKCVNGICESTTSSLTITVICNVIAPTLSASTPLTIGTGESTVLTATCASGQTVKWEDNSTTNPRTVSPSAASTTYSAKCVGICESPFANIIINTATRPSPPTITGPSSVCSGSSIILTPTGCPSSTYTYWYKNSETSSFNSSYQNNPISVLPTANTTYFARCKISTLESSNSNVISVTILNLPAQANNISATLSSAPNATVSLSADCSANTISWYSKGALNYSVYPVIGTETLLGTGSPISITLSPNTGYLVKCTDASTSCVSSASVNVINALSGADNTLTNGNYKYGNFIGTGNSFYYGDQTVELVPPNIDNGTTYFTKGEVFNSYSNPVTSSIQVIQRKNNNWEIGNYDGRPGGYIYSNTRTYRTKQKYTTNLPPCSAVWVKDLDNSEATFNITGFCDNAPSVPTPPTPVISGNATICAGQNLSLTATGCLSPDKVEWFLGSSSISFASGNSTISVMPLSASQGANANFSYTAKCTSVDNVRGLASNSLGVTVPGVYTPYYIEQTPNGTVFANSNVTLTAYQCYAPNGIKWEDNSTINPRVVIPLVTTTYSAKCTNQGCESTSSLSINILVNPCQLTRTLSSTATPTDDVSTGMFTIQAANAAGGKITATNKITGTANVTYQAKSIELNAGFKADIGTVFKAEIGGCN